jgi:deoxycytidylate deaminase
MNQRILNRVTEVAMAMRPSNIPKDERFHLSFAIRKGRIIKIGKNDYKKSHNRNKFGAYEPFKKDTVNPYIPCLHAEVNCAIRLGMDSWDGIEIVNVRLNNKGQLRISKPCFNCQKHVIDYLQPKSVFYSTDEGTFVQL